MQRPSHYVEGQADDDDPPTVSKRRRAIGLTGWWRAGDQHSTPSMNAERLRKGFECDGKSNRIGTRRIDIGRRRSLPGNPVTRNRVQAECVPQTIMNPSVTNRAWLPTARLTERVTTPSAKEFYRHYVRPGLPVVLRGAALGLGAIQYWSSAYLKAAAGKRSVPIEFSPDKEFALPERIGKDRIHSKFGRFVDYLLDGDASSPTTYYLAQVDTLQYLPELVGDIVRPSFAPLAEIMRPPYLWMGIGGNASTLHYDSYDNLYAMVSGRKHITLFPPSDRAHLYPYVDQRKHGHFSRVNLRCPDLSQFPDLLNARPFECVLSRGDILYIPEGWWHYLRSHGLNVAVNWWWIEDSAKSAHLHSV
jgi:hypothetical protein